MSKNKHYIQKVLQQLKQKKDCRIIDNWIFILSNNAPQKIFDLGNKSWGKIDYLTNHCGFFKLTVNDLSNKYLSNILIKFEQLIRLRNEINSKAKQVKN